MKVDSNNKSRSITAEAR